MTANSTSKLCRRLFQDSGPRAFIQQSLDQLIQRDQERFRAKWNFDVTKASSSTSWKIVRNPGASFYTRPPRILKAKRRLTPSMLESLRSEAQTPNKECLSGSHWFGHVVFDFSSPQVEKMEIATSASEPVQPPVSTVSSSVKSYGASSANAPLLADPIFKIPPVTKVLKRKPNPRMTDYFVVQKRSRDSIK
ncbi:hypothetical protein Aperf_G00000001546 [Anoplocephala perfoliata]